MAELRIGISGWRYAPWRGTFYPIGLVQKRELEFASRQVNSIEINGSFYSLQHVSSWKRWSDETPDDFIFSVKGSRYITHLKRLRSVKQPLANFFAQGILALEHKLGPILWQFPPNFSFDAERMETFMNLLPQDTDDASRLARRHDERLNRRSYLTVKSHRALRHAIEIRHESFRSPEFIALLRKHNIALVVADTAGKWPFLEDLTSDFVYARLHGDEELYVSGYTPRALNEWTKRVAAWQEGNEIDNAIHASEAPPPKHRHRDVYVYFDNDVKVRAPFDAISLARRTGGYTPKNLSSKPPENVQAAPLRGWPAVRNKRA
ncbi:MAG: DUF72 domain-containing protein [Candidatus Hydrogenedentes bacterium]|nr:DUF72 domain-containing protein [Candidatus Hydrogenedentota bacterium]